MTMLELFVTETPQRDPTAPAQHAFSGHVISMEHDRQRVFLNNEEIPIRNPSGIMWVTFVGLNDTIIATIGADANDERRQRFFNRLDIRRLLSGWYNCVNSIRYMQIFKFLI